MGVKTSVSAHKPVGLPPPQIPPNTPRLGCIERFSGKLYSCARGLYAFWAVMSESKHYSILMFYWNLWLNLASPLGTWPYYWKLFLSLCLSPLSQWKWNFIQDHSISCSDLCWEEEWPWCTLGSPFNLHQMPLMSLFAQTQLIYTRPFLQTTALS